MSGLFTFSISPAELVLRGTAMYWFLFALFRFVMRRDVGSIAIADVLLLVLIADASQNAMAGGYDTILDGMVLVGTIVGWNVLLDWAAFRFPLVQKLAEPAPLLLVSRGRILHRHLRREFITLDELHSKLREHGIEDIAQVKAARMESDGQISVVPFEPGHASGDSSRQGPRA